MVGRNFQDAMPWDGYRIFAPSVMELNLQHPDSIRRFIQDTKPDLIVHAAGLVGGIHANISRPVDFLTKNIAIGTNLILAAREYRVPKLINVGCSCMYPGDLASSISETDLLRGALEETNEGFALAKIIATKLCDYVSREASRDSQPQLRYITIVPCNLYGLYDNFDPSESHLIPAIIRKIHTAKTKNHSEVVIWGNGLARREYMYAADLIAGIKQAVVDYDKLPGILNLGVSQDYAVTEYYEIIADVVGWKGAFKYDYTRPNGTRQKKLNLSRQKVWGWSPSMSLKEGIELTYRYFLEKESEI